MYMNIETVLIIGTFALLAMVAGWARMVYLGARNAGAAREDSRIRAAAARQAFKASHQAGRAGAEAR